jgi:hypothetical protein
MSFIPKFWYSISKLQVHRYWGLKADHWYRKFWHQYRSFCNTGTITIIEVYINLWYPCSIIIHIIFYFSNNISDFIINIFIIIIVSIIFYPIYRVKYKKRKLYKTIISPFTNINKTQKVYTSSYNSKSSGRPRPVFFWQSDYLSPAPGCRWD